MLIWFIFSRFRDTIVCKVPTRILLGIIMKAGELDPIGSPGASVGLTPGKCASLFIQPLPPSVCQHHSDGSSSFIHRHTPISAPRAPDCKSQLNCDLCEKYRSYPKHYIIDCALMQEYKYNDCPPLKSRCIRGQLETHTKQHTL